MFLRNGGQKTVDCIKKHLDNALEMNHLLAKKCVKWADELLRNTLDQKATYCVVFDEAQRTSLVGRFPTNLYCPESPSNTGTLFTIIQSVTSSICNQYVIGTNLNLEAIINTVSSVGKHFVKRFFDTFRPATFDHSIDLLSRYFDERFINALQRVDPLPLCNTRFRMFDLLVESMERNADKYQNLEEFIAKNLDDALAKLGQSICENFNQYYTTDINKKVIDELVLYGSVQKRQLSQNDSACHDALAHGFCYTQTASRNIVGHTDFVNTELPMQLIMQDLVRSSHSPEVVPFVASFLKFAKSEYHPKSVTLEQFLPLVLVTQKIR